MVALVPTKSGFWPRSDGGKMNFEESLKEILKGWASDHYVDIQVVTHIKQLAKKTALEVIKSDKWVCEKELEQVIEEKFK